MSSNHPGEMRDRHGVKIRQFPIICEHCGKGFETVEPTNTGFHRDEWSKHLEPVYPTVEEHDGKFRPRCPHCDGLQAWKHAGDWDVYTHCNDIYFYHSELMFWCDCCDRMIGWHDDRCRRCAHNGPRHDNGREILDSRGEECSVCGDLRYPREIVEHHTSYVPEETVSVCGSCHGLIHKRDGFRDDLEPDMTREEWKEQRGRS